jgi:hypothetical protein
MLIKYPIMRRLLAFVLLAALPALAADRKLMGSWKISINVAGESHETACTFQQDAGKLTGTCKGESGEGPLTGQIDGEKITFSHQVPYNGDTITLTYTGTFSSDTEIKGSIDVAPFGVSGDFTGQKDASADKADKADKGDK